MVKTKNCYGNIDSYSISLIFLVFFIHVDLADVRAIDMVDPKSAICELIGQIQATGQTRVA